MNALRVCAHPWLAMAFGAFILCAETCNHFDEILQPAHWYDLPIYDWSAGVFFWPPASAVDAIPRAPDRTRRPRGVTW